MAMYNEITVEAELLDAEYMITKDYELLENKPQINSVELIGNKSLEDLGINPDAEENIIDTVKVNGAALTPDANKAVDVTITTGTNNGTVKVNGTDVNVKGLKSAAYTESSAYDVSGAAAAVQGNVDALAVVVNGKVDKVQGKGLSQNDYTDADKTKLAGIQAGAQVNTVTSVAGKTGAVTLNKSDVGLSNVDNTSDANKPVSNATQTALNGKVDKVEGYGLSENDYTTAEKTKLAGISAEANKVEITPVVTEGTTLATISIDGVDTAIKGSDIDVDSAMSPTSTNPVQNKVIYDALNNILPEETAEGNPISITDASGLSAKSCEVTMNPIQDLHGQDAPYPAGGMKNKLPFDLDTIKTNNTAGTWSGNNYTYNGVTWTVNEDGTYTTNGTATGGDSIFVIIGKGSDNKNITNLSMPSTDYKITTGFTDSGATRSYEIGYRETGGNVKHIYDNEGYNLVSANINIIQLVVREGYTANNLEFEPMIVPSTESDYTFIPYSNICPISGRDSVNVAITGKNLFPTIADTTQDGITYKNNADGSVTLSGTATRTTYFDIYNGNFDSAKYQGYKFGFRNEQTIGDDIRYRISASDRTSNMQDILRTSANFVEINDNGNNLYFSLRIGNGTNLTTPITIYPMMILPSETDYDFAPYQEQTHTATFPDTVYGGKVVWKDGVVKAIIDRLKYVIDGVNITALLQPNKQLFVVSGINSGVNSNGKDLCDKLYATNTTSAGTHTDNFIFVTNVGNYVVMYNTVFDSFESNTDANTWLQNNPVTLIHDIATPIEITLTPETIALLKGNNTLWTDGDNITLKYSADIKLYIAEQLSSLS